PGPERSEQGGVEGVDALEEEHAVRAQLELPSPEGEALARDEVEAGGAHGLAGEEALQLLAEERQVQRFEGFEIEGAVGGARGVLPIDVVVVQGELHRVEAVDLELDLEALDERGLARGGGAGDADD